MQLSELKHILQTERSALVRMPDPLPPLPVLRSLILPAGEKSHWAAYADFLVRLPDELVEALAGDLLEWAQDLNWPGCRQIMQRLLGITADVRSAALLAARQSAARQNDEEWLYNLDLIFGEQEQ